MKIEFEGMGLFDVLAQMDAFMQDATAGMNSIVEAPVEEPEPEEKPKPKAKAKKKPLIARLKEEAPEVSEETPEPEPEPAPDMDPAEAKKKAVEILIQLYTDGKQDTVKKLLASFNVAKFGEVPEADGQKLLDAAENLQKEPA